MDLVTIIIVAIGIGAALLYTLAHGAFDKLFEGLWRALGLRSGKGSLVTRVTTESDRIVLAVENQGQHKIRLVAVEGRDGNMKQTFPTPYLNADDSSNPSTEEMARKEFSNMSISPGQSITVILNKPELVSLDCQTLAMLDTEGKTWPVDDFHIDDVMT